MNGDHEEDVADGEEEILPVVELPITGVLDDLPLTSR